MNDFKVFFKRLSEHSKMPTYAKEGDAACDLYSAENYVLDKGGRTLVRCGFAMEMPEGFEAQVRPRSGLAVKHGITVLNSPGTIDFGYRGEVMVSLINLGDDTYIVSRGERIAQMTFAFVYTAHFLDVGDNELSSSDRGTGGIGHTGN